MLIKLDMQVTSIKEHECNIVKTGSSKNLKVFVIYGANASSKTNVS